MCLSCQVLSSAHTRSLTCGVLCHPLKSSGRETGTFISWMRTEWLRDHRIDWNLDKFSVSPKSYSDVSGSKALPACINKELLNESMFWGGFLWKEKEMDALSQNMSTEILSHLLNMRDNVKFLTWSLIPCKLWVLLLLFLLLIPNGRRLCRQPLFLHLIWLAWFWETQRLESGSPGSDLRIVIYWIGNPWPAH